MSYDLNFLEACKALTEKKCTKIENKVGTQYAVDEDGILSVLSVLPNIAHSGIRRSPSEFLMKWKLVDKIPVKHEKVIEDVTWHKSVRSFVTFPISDKGTFLWGDLINKPKMQVILRWKE